MRLVKVEFKGYKRLRDTSINLDAPSVAIVGPNEAGKTSLLDALAHLTVEGEFSPRELSRKVRYDPNAVIVRGWFEVGEVEKALLASTPEAANARWFVIEKLRSGRLQRYLTPRVDRDRTNRRRLETLLTRLQGTQWANATSFDGEETVAARTKAVLAILRADVDTLDAQALASLRAFRDELAELRGPATAANVIAAIEPTIRTETAPHPRDAARDALIARVPPLLKFDLPDRELASEYDLAAVDISNPPAALDNLAQLAGYDLTAAVSAVRSGEYGEKLGMVEDANRRLERIFRESWGQDETLVHLDQDESLLRIFVSNPGGGYSAIAERSDGLRTFVALIAFIALADPDVPPILLIDEAETHLHYDAQSDLMRVFARQRAAAKIIYTTHSAGCLPEDLGTGIRLLEPVGSSDESKVKNSFWTARGGFANLLIGMGASALAFASTRYAVIGEGGADVVLLPTLVREACAREVVGYQVAPGLAEAAPSAVAELEFAAARVAYVVDDDTGGRGIARKLRGGGIPAARIIVLGRGRRGGIVLEDTLAPAVFRDAVNAELERSGQAARIPLAAIPSRGRPTALAAWARKSGIPAPNRVAVASRVLERAGPKLSSPGANAIRALDADVRAVFGTA